MADRAAREAGLADLAAGSEMRPVHPEYVPDPTLSRAEMETLQREIGETAIFEDENDLNPARAWTGDPPIVCGVDQAFLEDRAVSAIVATRGDEVIERVYATTELRIEYIPGLLSFREGESIVAAFQELAAEPDVVLFDGSGRIHFRQAGLATHMGVVFDVPSIGVAKRLLCGRLLDPPAEPFPEGTRVPVVANARVDAPDGTVIGTALQTRQYDGARHINPLYVSPGHRVGVDTAADVVERSCAGYKLPEPIRLADSYVGEVKTQIADDR